MWAKMTLARNCMSYEFQLKRNPRMRGIKISIRPTGTVLVSASPWIPRFAINQFVSSKNAWIKAHLPKKPLAKTDPGEFIRLKPQARSLVTARLDHFNRHYHHRWTKINIRNQSTRWGSCNALGVLSFNYRLATISPELADYVIVHELCHLRELNHSQKFWNLVGETLPDHKILRKKLNHLHAYKID